MVYAALRRRCTARRRRGAAVVEFAVLAPVMILLVFGMIDVGRALMVQHLLTNAARDGARAATLDGATANDVESQVAEYLADSSVPRATVTVAPNPLDSAASGDPVTVAASVSFDSVGWLPSSWYLRGVTLKAAVVMRREAGSSSP